MSWRGSAWVLASWAVTVTAVAQPAPCPSQPTLGPPDWFGDGEVPSVADARALVARRGEELAQAPPGDPRRLERIRQLAEANGVLYRAARDRRALRDAAESLERLSREHPAHPHEDRGLYVLAWAYHELGLYDEERLAMDRASRGHPSSPFTMATLLRLAWTHWRSGDIEEARQQYLRVAALGAGVQTAYAYYMAAWCLVRMARSDGVRLAVEGAGEALDGSSHPVAEALREALERDACRFVPRP
ncbi:MAG: tetratricopeptide repeat protein [Sandaracinaceae bacterium]|nr:tetratricopeptide repeat protein [Sandaracinaceae bacterium]